MRKSILTAAASLGAMLLASAPASAAITFSLDDVNFLGGGALTGTFTTSDDLDTLLDFSITTTANDYGIWGDFPGGTYTFANASAVIWSPDFGFAADFASPISQIGLLFAGPLTATGTQLLVSEETVIKLNGGMRFATSGTVSVAAVPEPATWAMMIAGFGLAGAALRRRKTVVAFA